MPRLVVLITAALGATFVLALGATLPGVVVSQFGLSGQPTSTMARGPFVALMAVLTAGVPVLSYWLQARKAAAGSAKIRHAAHWFAAGRREATVRWLGWHAALFSVATTVFMGFVFWLVASAHAGGALPTLPQFAFTAGLVAYLVFTVAWVTALHLRFRRPVAD